MRWVDYRNKILQSLNYQVFYENELENVDRRGNEIKAKCPYADLHDDGTDRLSFTVNLDKGVFYCHSCHSKGNAHTLLMYMYNKAAEEAWFLLGDGLELERPDAAQPDRPPINAALPALYHKNLMDITGPLLKDVLMNKRGFTKETLKQFQIGWDRERISIPIYDEFNELVNIRRYKWNAETSAEKFKNFVDDFQNSYGELRIYGIENLIDESIEEIIWNEGETDRILLEQYGFHAATPTSGAGSFKDEWTRYFKNKKKVYIIQDNDEPGRIAAKKIAEKLYRIVPCYIVDWPADFIDKGDITDFFVTLRYSVEKFKELLQEAKAYKIEESAEDDEVVEVHLAQASNHEFMGKKQKIPIMCSGKDTAPYVAPKRVKISCIPKDDKCAFCDNAAYAGEQIINFTAKKQETISLIQCTTNQQQNVLKEAAKIRDKCNSFNVEVLEYMNIEELRAIPQAETNFEFSKEHEYVVRKCYYIGKNLKTNQRYMMTGYSHAEPKTQYVTHIFDDAVPTKDRISQFEMTDELMEQLKIFQVKEGQTVKEKFEEMHLDLERNVTYVWERRQVGMAIDLVYHTALSFYFQDQFVRRGWGELLIIGDSGQAKSTIVERLMRHYQLGELYSGEASRRTGLVYSFQQTQKRWFLIWGAWPLNDGGLVVIDEFGGISEDEVAQMSDVRSSGIARATGVITAETNARTRGIFMANPRNGRPLATETHGVNAVLKLLGKTEDVRRLDLVIAVASGDVPTELINRTVAEVSKVAHTYDTELCKNRVLWCWSRRPEQIVFTTDATKHILNEATKMGKKYSARIPIVEPADQRLKIARLSIAAAGCVFSTEDGEKLIVKKEHVDFVVKFMNEIYDARNLDYGAFSESANEDLYVSPDRLKILRGKFALLPVVDPNSLAQVIYEMQYFRRGELQDSTGLGNEDLLRVMSFLNINKIIERTMSGYRKTTNGIKLLKELLEDPITKAEREQIRGDKFKNSEF